MCLTVTNKPLPFCLCLCLFMLPRLSDVLYHLSAYIVFAFTSKSLLFVAIYQFDIFILYCYMSSFCRVLWDNFNREVLTTSTTATLNHARTRLDDYFQTFLVKPFFFARKWAIRKYRYCPIATSLQKLVMERYVKSNFCLC